MIGLNWHFIYISINHHYISQHQYEPVEYESDIKYKGKRLIFHRIFQQYSKNISNILLPCNILDEFW